MSTPVCLSHLDTCLSDYFQGCSPDRGIVLAISVFKEMNRQELIDAICDEWRGDSTEDARFEDVTEEEVRDAAEGMLCATPSDVGLFKYAPSRDDEEGESPYAYILVHASC